MRSSLVTGCLLALSLLAGCRPNAPMANAERESAGSPSTGPGIVLPDGYAVAVELATDDETRQQGLMHRESLEPGKGMLFVFPVSSEYPFWMKNTMIPLDIIWIDEARRVAHVEPDVPPCPGDPCPPYPPGAVAKYVLELKAGEAARHRLKEGDVVELKNLDGVVVR